MTNTIFLVEAGGIANKGYTFVLPTLPRIDFLRAAPERVKMLQINAYMQGMLKNLVAATIKNLER